MYYLKLVDTVVLEFDFDKKYINVVNSSLLPFSLRGSDLTVYNIESYYEVKELLLSWLSYRGMSMSRDNAKSLCTLYGISQANTIDNRLKLLASNNGISVIDSYWVTSNISQSYNSVNPRHGNFIDLGDTALDGILPCSIKHGLSPELTSHGVFRKAWYYIKNDGLYLVKSDRTFNNINTRLEVLASKIIACFNTSISAVAYRGYKRKGYFVSKCKCFVDDYYSFVEAEELLGYFGEICFRELAFTRGAGELAVLDYIVANTDRHTQNYGFMMDNLTGELLGFAPAFDFNMSLLETDIDMCLSPMFCSNDTLLSLAKVGIQYSNLTLNIKKFNNLKYRYPKYRGILDTVLYRVNKLGIKVV